MTMRDGQYATVYTGDCVDLLETGVVEPKSVELLVTSPPYPGQKGNAMTGHEWSLWISSVLSMANATILSDTATVVINAMSYRNNDSWADTSIFRLPDLVYGSTGYNGSPLRLWDTYIYGKANPPPNGAIAWADAPGWEVIYVFSKRDKPGEVLRNHYRLPYKRKSLLKNGNLYTTRTKKAKPHPDGARQSTLMMMSKSADQNRPSAKGISFPRELPRRFIWQHTQPGDLVLDPFCGVGTTLVEAIKLGRSAVGFELDPEEAEKAREWVMQEWRELKRQPRLIGETL